MVLTELTARSKRLRFALMASVLLLSAFIQLHVASRTWVDVPLRTDALKYVSYAWNMDQHHTFSHVSPFDGGALPAITPDKLTLPGYPAFLSLLLHNTLDQEFVRRVVTVQAWLGIATCLMTLLIGLRVLPFGLAITACLITAISPHLATSSTYVLTESLFAFLLTAALLLGVMAVNSGSRLWKAMVAGAVLGLASLVRPQMELFPWVLAILTLAIPSWRVHRRKAFIGLLCFLAVTMPWQVRNLTVDRAPGDPDLLVTALYHGAFPGLMYENDPSTAGYAYRGDPLASEHSRSLGSVAAYIADGFRKHPQRYVAWYTWGKAASFLSWTDPSSNSDIFFFPVTASPYVSETYFIGLHILAYWLHWPLVLMALAASVIAGIRPSLLSTCDDRQTAVRLLALAFAYIILMHMFGAPYPRYGVPFRPLMYLLAMAFMATIAINRVQLDTPSDAMRHKPPG